MSEVYDLMSFPLPPPPYHSSAMRTRLSTSSLPSWTPTIALLTRWYSAPSSVPSPPGSMKGRRCGLDSSEPCQEACQHVAEISSKQC